VDCFSDSYDLGWRLHYQLLHTYACFAAAHCETVASSDQSRAVLLTLLDGTNESIRSASVVRVVALTNILAILWLEFSAFADVSSKLIISESILWGAMFLYGCAFAVLYFTLRFGLRGFLFADLFHGPIMIIGIVTLLIGVVVFLVGDVALPHWRRLVRFNSDRSAGRYRIEGEGIPAACKADNLDGSVQVVVCFLQQVTNT